MKRPNQFTLALGLLVGLAGCATEVPVRTHFISEPPGTRIEVNGNYIGTTPVDFTLPQTPNHHKLKGDVTIIAMPSSPDQKQQQKILRHRQEAPAQVLFDMTLDESGNHARTDKPPVAATSDTN